MMNNFTLGYQNLVSVCFLYYRRDIHLLGKDQLEEIYTSTWSMNVKLIIHLADNHAHAYTIYHIISSLMHSWYSFVHIDTIGSPKGVTLLEFEPEHQEEEQAAQEQEVQAEGGVNVEDLPECPDHQPSSFLKGKPRSIISLLCFYKYHLRPLCLMHQVIRVDWNHLLHILSLSR